jgi:hypothetical protein
MEGFVLKKDQKKIAERSDIGKFSILIRPQKGAKNTKMKFQGL